MRGFARLSLATTLATYLLIAIGALVRAAGAGLGCPDWPKCFGQWIPPMRAEELPPGFDPAQFILVHTWLEYINRLIGVVIGFLIFATLISAWRNHRKQPRIVWPTTAAFLLVGAQGYLGGQVVEQALRPVVLTAHMLLALIIVGLLLYAHLESRFHVDAAARDAGHVPERAQRRLGTIGLGLGVFFLVQVGVGTAVRSELQLLERADVPRESWLPLGWWPDLAHRQLAVLALLACVGLVWLTRRLAPAHRQLMRWSQVQLALVAVQILSGLGMAYISVPPPLQVVHLALASLLFGALSVYVFIAYRVPEPA
ncbi:cytochrome oxidase assembly [Haliangium ochraceum DSM 14365]|uniref:Cytochrome oxidase assembly n=2 Tax=Haliangium ochraceum TaxID=80816 RepID=D0LKG7_HALO1|nr:cytochrome oxidase assembly [Haliangium ochraceum DSM 14365]